MRISDWSSDVCSSDLLCPVPQPLWRIRLGLAARGASLCRGAHRPGGAHAGAVARLLFLWPRHRHRPRHRALLHPAAGRSRSEEHTSELQSLMRISYAVFCLKKKNKSIPYTRVNNITKQSRTSSTTL